MNSIIKILNWPQSVDDKYRTWYQMIVYFPLVLVYKICESYIKLIDEFLG